jgi:molybdopterin/thiamine biosynthesis adenylyltransferase
MIRSGICDIKIVDNDMFTADNLLRHELGVYFLYRDKAESLARHYEFKYPFVKIDHLKADVIELLSISPDMFEKYDLVISALGNPTAEMLLNKKLHQLEKSPPIIFTWVEPFGIGGHALVTLNKKRTGCYECLHTNPAEPTTEYINRASFAAPRQTFSKTVSGCGTQFTPYGSLDAYQTAIIATRLAINLLTGEEKDNPLMSWKGNATKFINSGFRLSDRFELKEEQLFDIRYSYKTDRCKVCSER